jgi:2-amino-4-hydroxy-6-hydroxymethyldihydropteridine diphosphokinase
VQLIYLGLGSNIGDREANLRAAIGLLSAPDLRVLRISHVYETEPMDYADQPQFLNLAVEAETSLSPAELLRRIGEIERSGGRVRITPNGPRTIDIDILLYGEVVERSASLEIPHPRMAGRRFVLAPLADLAPDLIHPVMRRTVRQLLAAAPPAGVRRINLELR